MSELCSFSFLILFSHLNFVNAVLAIILVVVLDAAFIADGFTALDTDSYGSDIRV